MIFNGMVYIAGFTIYITCIVIFVCLILLAHRKFQDPNFLRGMIISGILSLLFLLANISFYFFLAYILSFLFGFVAGYFNTIMKRGLLSGVAGIFLSWLLFGALPPFGFLAFYSAYYIVLLIIPSTVCGAIGGVVGNIIRARSDAKMTSEMPKEKVKSNDL